MGVVDNLVDLKSANAIINNMEREMWIFWCNKFKEILDEDIEDIKKGTDEIRYRGPDDQKILSDKNFYWF